MVYLAADLGAVPVVVTGATLVNMAVNAVLPVLVALITARNASPALKAVVLAVASVISGLVTAWESASSAGLVFDWRSALISVVSGYVIAVTAHTGLLKQINITGKNGLIQLRLPGGLGDSKLDRSI